MSQVLQKLRLPLPRTISEATRTTGAGHALSLHGWIRSVRHQKKLSFVHLTDGQADIQVTLSPELARGLSTGTSVRVDGSLAHHPRTQTIEVRGTHTHIYGTAPGDTYPMQKKEHGSEHLRDNAHLRTRTSQIGHVVKLRHHLTRCLLEWFHDNSFTLVQPPVITSSDCEGAGEAFQVVAGAGRGNEAKEQQQPDYHHHQQPPFFSHPAFLTVSTQLHLEAVAGAFARVFSLSPTFRAEPSQTSRHLAEFWMLEAEISFVESVDSLTSVVEHSIKSAVGGLDPSLVKSDSLYLEKEWGQITYTEAVQLLRERHSVSPFHYPPTWGASLQSEHERYLAEEVCESPVFITHYPASIKPFYMRANDDGLTVACFDLLVPGIGELAGGSLREERLDVLERNIDHAGLDRGTYNWYLDLRRYGSVPHGGFGVGFERLLSVISGVSNLRDVVLFPRWAGRCNF
ncbi:hypothetical protein E3P77_00127 [Wallemia ichthyophaga]|nr:hypothetical protein E3P77_00127 [Wallemia ichthyophaga]